MSGKTVLVSGGSAGIGAAIASGLQQQGHRVAVLSRTPPAATGVEHVACDLRSPPAVRAAIGTWLQSVAGVVDAVVHSAVDYGSDGRHPFATSTLAEWDAALDVNARGLFLLALHLLPGMRDAGRGLLVEVSSDIASEPGPGRIVYAASKAAARAVMLGLAAELDGTGVAVVQVAPTAQVDTRGLRGRRPAGFDMRGYASPDSLVPVVAWLLATAANARAQHGRCLWVAPDGHWAPSDPGSAP